MADFPARSREYYGGLDPENAAQMGYSGIPGFGTGSTPAPNTENPFTYSTPNQSSYQNTIQPGWTPPAGDTRNYPTDYNPAEAGNYVTDPSGNIVRYGTGGQWVAGASNQDRNQPGGGSYWVPGGTPMSQAGNLPSLYQDLGVSGAMGGGGLTPYGVNHNVAPNQPTGSPAGDMLQQAKQFATWFNGGAGNPWPKGSIFSLDSLNNDWKSGNPTTGTGVDISGQLNKFGIPTPGGGVGAAAGRAYFPNQLGTSYAADLLRSNPGLLASVFQTNGLEQFGALPRGASEVSGWVPPQAGWTSGSTLGPKFGAAQVQGGQYSPGQAGVAQHNIPGAPWYNSAAFPGFGAGNPGFGQNTAANPNSAALQNYMQRAGGNGMVGGGIVNNLYGTPNPGTFGPPQQGPPPTKGDNVGSWVLNPDGTWSTWTPPSIGYTNNTSGFNPYAPGSEFSPKGFGADVSSPIGINGQAMSGGGNNDIGSFLQMLFGGLGGFNNTPQNQNPLYQLLGLGGQSSSPMAGIAQLLNMIQSLQGGGLGSQGMTRTATPLRAPSLYYPGWAY